MSDHDREVDSQEGPRSANAPREVIETLPELNDFCLQVLAEQARVGCAHAVVSKIARAWLALDPPARRRAASHPFLLFDAGLSDADRWRSLDWAQVQDAPPWPYESLFTVSQAVAATELVFVFAWSLARRHAVQARLALGMHPLCLEWITGHSVLAAHQLGRRQWARLRPRWLGIPEFWEELLRGAAQGGAAHLRARVQGIRLMAAETAAALGRGGYNEPD